MSKLACKGEVKVKYVFPYITLYNIFYHTDKLSGQELKHCHATQLHALLKFSHLT